MNQNLRYTLKLQDSKSLTGLHYSKKEKMLKSLFGINPKPPSKKVDYLHMF